MEIPRMVYAIRHNPTGRIYVGSSGKPWNRMRTHFDALKGGYHKNAAMQRDCEQHGFDYSVFMLDTIHDFNDRNKEQLWMDALNTRDPAYGYNASEKALPAEIANLAEYHVTLETDADHNDFREWLEKRWPT